MGVKSKKPTKTASVKNGHKTEERNNRGQFVSGNTLGKGRPKKENCVSDLLRNKGDEIQDDGKTKLQAVIDTLYLRASQGELKAIDMIFDRLEGKPAQKLELEETLLPTGFDIGIIKN